MTDPSAAQIDATWLRDNLDKLRHPLRPSDTYLDTIRMLATGSFVRKRVSSTRMEWTRKERE